MRPIHFFKISSKTIARLFFLIGFLFVLVLVGAVLLLPKIVEHPLAQEKIKTLIAQRLEGQFDIEKIALLYRDGPHISLEQARLETPALAAKIGTAIIWPRIGPLFSGHFLIHKLKLTAPEVEIKIQTGLQPKKGPTTKRSEQIRRMLMSMAAATIQAGVEVENGRLFFVAQEGGHLVNISGLSIRKIALQNRILMKARTNLSKTFYMDVTYDRILKNSKGTLTIGGFKPDLLSAVLFHSADMQLADSNIDLAIDFEADSSGQFKIDAAVTNAMFNVVRHKHRYRFVLDKFLAAYHFKDGAQRLSIDPLRFLSPQLTATVTLTAARPADKNDPLLALVINAKKIKVHTVQAVALDLLGDIPFVKELFSILKSGHVPSVSISLGGSSFKTLGQNINDIEVRGILEAGVVSIPTLDWTLNQASGEIVFKDGYLNGQNLSATYGELYGYQGSLRLGFKRPKNRLHVDAAYKTDLKQIPAILARFVSDSPFAAVFDQWHHIQGQAAGHILLDGPTDKLDVKVTTDKLNLAAAHRKRPLQLDIENAKLTYDGQHIEISDLKGRLNKSSYNQITTSVVLKPTPRIASLAGEVVVHLDDLDADWLSTPAVVNTIGKLEAISGTMPLTIRQMDGLVFKPETWKIESSGLIEQALIRADALPAPLIIQNARLKTHAKGLIFNKAQVRLDDARFDVSGSLSGSWLSFESGHFDISGDVGPKIAAWISKRSQIPPQIRTSAFNIANTHIDWVSKSSLSWEGDLRFENSAQLSANGSLDKDNLHIKKLHLIDRVSEVRAVIDLDRTTNRLGLQATGRLGADTLIAFLTNPFLTHGELKGDVRLVRAANKTLANQISVKLNGSKLQFVLSNQEPIGIEQVALDADGAQIRFEAKDFNWDETQLSAKGTFFLNETQTRFQMTVNADVIDGDFLLTRWPTSDPSTSDAPSTQFWRKPLLGKAQISAKRFHLKKKDWQSVEAQVHLTPQGTDISLTQALFCGIATRGNIRLTSDGVKLDFKAAAESQPLQETIMCLTRKPNRTEGLFNLSGALQADAKKDHLDKALKGSFDFDAGKGRIYGIGVLGRIFARIFNVLNITEIFVGRLPDLSGEGFGFHTIKGRAHFKSGHLIIENLFVDGASMKLFGQGQIDLETTQTDMTVLAAPIKSVDRIVSIIPVIKKIFPQGVVAIPIKISGEINNPSVTPLAPDVVGKGLLNFVQNTLTLPIKLIRWILP